MNGFELLPAIDIRGARVVRLHQGDFKRETRYGDDPLRLAQAYADAGAAWLHLVDLDAARDGGYTLAPLLASIRRTTSLRVQTGGGIRTRADLDRVLDAGADRVVVGSLAVRDPGVVQRWLGDVGTDRITVALDARRVAGRWRLPVAGWTQESGMLLDDLVADYAAAGLRHLLCTDIDRDGMLSGFNLPLYRELLALAPGLKLQASGGARCVADVVAVREAGCGGAVLGKSLLDGQMSLADALGEARPC